jgi:hypothetical protein
MFFKYITPYFFSLLISLPEKLCQPLDIVSLMWYPLLIFILIEIMYLSTRKISL